MNQPLMLCLLNQTLKKDMNQETKKKEEHQRKFFDRAKI
jgi:hypothetical protein